MTKSKRGFAAMPKSQVRQIASMGGSVSPTKFEPDSWRAKIAGQKGGLARSNDWDIKSGRVRKKGAKARWDNTGDGFFDDDF